MLIILMLSLVTMTLGDCDNSIIPELTFRLGGNNLDWPGYATQKIYAENGRYIPKHVIATRSQIYRDTAFVAMPRYRSGVPFTLGRIDLRKGKCSIPIAPYPCFNMNEEGSCQALQNVIDIFLDRQVRPDEHPNSFPPFLFLFYFLNLGLDILCIVMYSNYFLPYIYGTTLEYSVGLGYGYR